ncbi:hypothetical protein GGR90_002208 [Sphingopyxis italica]|uniref:Uncharacterized protein n=1 Tax=Sphingopyxis italica TaxID=1129133 RepID=A0A7X6BA14_9SPHN|nr:hypothetical protein [Sphingopyxis italica]NJB90033.1 hypothetical protein [Sphingopyxis italica]
MMNLLSALYWFDEALQAALKEAGIPNVSRAQSMLIAISRRGNIARRASPATLALRARRSA